MTPGCRTELNTAARATGHVIVALEVPSQCLAACVLSIRSGARGDPVSKRFNVSIRVDEHTRWRGLRADESEFARVSTVRKEAFTPAQQDRVDDQHNLVEQSPLKQHGRQGRTSPDDQVGAVA